MLIQYAALVAVSEVLSPVVSITVSVVFNSLDEPIQSSQRSSHDDTVLTAVPV